MESAWPILGRLSAVIGLVIANGFFVAAELALVKVRETQLEAQVRRGHRRARVAQLLIRNLDTTISATQLGITLASLGLGVLVEPVFAALLDPLFQSLRVTSGTVRHTTTILLGFFVNAYLLIVVGELTPKALAIRQTLPVALGTARPLRWFCRIAYPFIWVLEHSAQWLLRQLGIEAADEGERAHSEEELRLLLATSPGAGARGQFGRNIVLNALELRHRVARDVMRPRQEIVGLDAAASIAECLDVAERTRYSRFPITEGGDLDRTLGVVHIKDLYAMRIKARTGRDLLPAVRKLIYVPPTARLEKLLQLFLERRLHFALVVDEYGGTLGMVTIENILEEVVGQIQDEFDQEKPLCVKLDERTWELDGALPLHQLADLIGESIHEEGLTTTSGWITQRVGGFPKVGDVLLLIYCELRVEEMDGMRVARVRLTRRGPDDASMAGRPDSSLPTS
jgi:CBS domain containing-hemolysin-like protein